MVHLNICFQLTYGISKGLNDVLGALRNAPGRSRGKAPGAGSLHYCSNAARDIGGVANSPVLEQIDKATLQKNAYAHKNGWM